MRICVQGPAGWRVGSAMVAMVMAMVWCAVGVAATISGVVVDGTGAPAAGAMVRSRSSGESVRAAEDGTFSLEVKRISQQWADYWAVSADGMAIGTGRLPLEEGNPAVPRMTITLSPGRIITGRVLDESSNPVEGAIVAGCDQVTIPSFGRSDAVGNFRFVYPADCPIRQVYAVHPELGFDYTCTEEFGSYSGLTPPDKIRNDGFELTLHPMATLKFRLVTRDDTPLVGRLVHRIFFGGDSAVTPVADLDFGPWLIRKIGEPGIFNTAYAPNEIFSARSDADGIVVLRCVPKSMYEKTTYSTYSTGGGTANWDELEHSAGSATDFPVTPQVTARGSVKLEDGTPVPWTRVSRKNHNGCGHGIRWTDENGEFELVEDAGQLLDLGVDESRFGAAPGVFAFDVGDGSVEKRVDFVLKPGIRLYGRVLRPDGTPGENFSVFMGENSPEPSPVATSMACPPGGCPTGVVVRQTSDYRVEHSEGRYEYTLPAVPRSYSISVDLDSDPELSFQTEFELRGDEQEYHLDLPLRPPTEKSDSVESE